MSPGTWFVPAMFCLGVCSCFGLTCWGKLQFILHQSVVEPVLIAVRTHASILVSFLALLTESNRNATGKKSMLAEVDSIQIYPQLSLESSLLALAPGFSLHLPYHSPHIKLRCLHHCAPCDAAQKQQERARGPALQEGLSSTLAWI